MIGAACGVVAYHKFRPQVAPAIANVTPHTTVNPFNGTSVVSAIPPARFSTPIGYSARLKEVVDGNTLAVIGNNDRESIVRLADVDAPALDQPYGVQARDELRRLTANATLQIMSSGVTAGGMDHAHIIADGIDVGRALLRAGAVRVATPSSPPPDLTALEDEARAAQRGLWALPALDRMRPCWWRGDC